MMESSSTNSGTHPRPLRTRHSDSQWFVHAAFLCLLATVFIFMAHIQAKNLNLSAAAGGQMPYLHYAKQIAEKGISAWYGDHNRLPLVPTLLALMYTNDWSTFVARSIWFSITLSTVVMLGVSTLAFRVLPSLMATVFCAIFAFTVLLSRASFVQAELLYYGLSFFSWLLLCRMLQKPTGWLAGATGLTLGLTYLTKASAWPMLPAYLVTMIVSQLWSLIRHHKRDEPIPNRRIAKPWGCGGIVVATFFLIISPYVWHNYQHFGRLFYNVNSTFFMWCDSWPEAQAFAQAYPIGDSFPNASDETIPSIGQYWRTHTTEQMWSRLRYGVATLFKMAVHGVYFKYFAISLGFCAVMAWRLRHGLISAIKAHGFALLFSAFCFWGYLLAYTWYVPVAYGDRFVLSLYTPLLFSLFWLPLYLTKINKLTIGRWTNSDRWINRFSVLMLVLLVLDVSFSIRKTLYHPPPNFVRFYYNESKELLHAGYRDKAVRGLLGVVKLDPDFAPAHVDLGMMALTAGKTQEAISWLGQAVSIDPSNADAWNSLGSAWSTAGDFHQGIVAFQHAVDLKPAFAMAWYNMGGAYSQIGSIGKARDAHAILMALNKNLAKQLIQLLPDDSSATSEP